MIPRHHDPPGWSVLRRARRTARRCRYGAWSRHANPRSDPRCDHAADRPRFRQQRTTRFGPGLAGPMDRRRARSRRRDPRISGVGPQAPPGRGTHGSPPTIPARGGHHRSWQKPSACPSEPHCAGAESRAGTGATTCRPEIPTLPTHERSGTALRRRSRVSKIPELTRAEFRRRYGLWETMLDGCRFQYWFVPVLASSTACAAEHDGG